MAPRNHLRTIIAGVSLLLMVWAPTTAAQLNPDIKKHLRLGQYSAVETILIKDADSGNPDAAFHLARIYQTGHVRAPHSDRAEDLLNQAADAGNAEAMFLLGKLYTRKSNTPAHNALAHKWYTRAAQAGNRKAQRALANLVSQETPQTIAQDPRSLVQACDSEKISAADKERIRTLNAASLQAALNCDNADAMVRSLASAGAVLDQTDDAGNALLHAAVSRGKVAAAQYLYHDGADANQKNNSGWSARMLAQRSGNPDLKKLFGVMQAPTGALPQALNAAAKDGQYKGWSALNLAAWHGKASLVDDLLDEGIDINGTDATGHTALSRALARKNSQISAMLLEHGAEATEDDVAALSSIEDPRLLNAYLGKRPKDRFIAQILCTAARNGSLRTTHAVAPHLKEPDAPCGETTPLVLASRAGHSQIVQLLLDQGADFTRKDASGCSALCWALRNGHDKVAHLLAQRNTANSPDKLGVTPLMLAAIAGNLRILEQLLADGAEVNEKSLAGSHALLQAAAAGQLPIVTRLLERGSLIDQKNAAGDTALIAAVRAGHLAVARQLLEHGASRNAHNARFESARDLALKKNDEQWTTLFKQRSSLWGTLNGGP